MSSWKHGQLTKKSWKDIRNGHAVFPLVQNNTEQLCLKNKCFPFGSGRRCVRWVCAQRSNHVTLKLDISSPCKRQLLFFSGIKTTHWFSPLDPQNHFWISSGICSRCPHTVQLDTKDKQLFACLLSVTVQCIVVNLRPWCLQVCSSQCAAEMACCQHFQDTLFSISRTHLVLDKEHGLICLSCLYGVSGSPLSDTRMAVP